jgi:hypothetical protein
MSTTVPYWSNMQTLTAFLMSSYGTAILPLITTPPASTEGTA